MFRKVSRYFLTAVLPLIFTVLIWFSAQAATAAQIDFYFSPTCPHCAKEEIFLDDLSGRYPELVVNRYNIGQVNNVEKLKGQYRQYQVPENVWGIVPVTFIGDHYFLGFDEDKSPVALEAATQSLLTGKTNNSGMWQNIADHSIRPLEKISLPFLGDFSVAKMSPLALSMTVGFLDGFNACALVTLGFLLTLLVAAGDRRRLIVVGGTFILVSGMIYFIFIAAWLNLFLFLGYIKIITAAVALAVIIFAVLLLKEYFYGVLCKFCDVSEERESQLAKWQKKLFARLAKAVAADMPLAVTLGIVAAVAVGVNLIELFCSLGFPLAYTKVLAAYNSSAWSYYGYLLVYVLFYMLNALLLFFLALATWRVTKISHKYLEVIKLISGFILLFLGLIMLINPGWLFQY